MALAVTRCYKMGSHVSIFRDGDAFTVPTSGTAGRQSKPGATDPAWIISGVVEECSFTLDQTETKVYAPAPGRARLYDVIPTKEDMLLKFSCAELSPWAVEQIFRTLPLTSGSTQFNPLEGKPKRAWVKWQTYDQEDQLRAVLDLFCYLKVAGEVQFGNGELCKVPFEALVLHSTLNTGTL